MVKYELTTRGKFLVTALAVLLLLVVLSSVGAFNIGDGGQYDDPTPVPTIRVSFTTATPVPPAETDAPTHYANGSDEPDLPETAETGTPPELEDDNGGTGEIPVTSPPPRQTASPAGTHTANPPYTPAPGEFIK
jgi:hypothetical protein